MSRKLLSQYTVEELLQRAAEFDAMAATATTASVRCSLEVLAVRFRTLAARRDTAESVREG